jgi:hypothetical protein
MAPSSLSGSNLSCAWWRRLSLYSCVNLTRKRIFFLITPPVYIGKTLGASCGGDYFSKKLQFDLSFLVKFKLTKFYTIPGTASFIRYLSFLVKFKFTKLYNTWHSDFYQIKKYHVWAQAEAFCFGIISLCKSKFLLCSNVYLTKNKFSLLIS